MPWWSRRRTLQDGTADVWGDLSEREDPFAKSSVFPRTPLLRLNTRHHTHKIKRIDLDDAGQLFGHKLLRQDRPRLENAEPRGRNAGTVCACCARPSGPAIWAASLAWPCRPTAPRSRSPAGPIGSRASAKKMNSCMCSTGKPGAWCTAFAGSRRHRARSRLFAGRALPGGGPVAQRHSRLRHDVGRRRGATKSPRTKPMAARFMACPSRRTGGLPPPVMMGWCASTGRT